jgi:hypothetical protein
MMVRTSVVLMEKSPGVVSVISAFRVAPPAATEVDSDGDAENDNRRSQEVLSKMATFIPIGCTRALKQKDALNYQLVLSKKKKANPGSELVCCLSCNAVAGVLKATQEKSRFCHQHEGVARSQLLIEINLEPSIEGTAPRRNDRYTTTCHSMPCPIY